MRHMLAARLSLYLVATFIAFFVGACTVAEGCAAKRPPLKPGAWYVDRK